MDTRHEWITCMRARLNPVVRGTSRFVRSKKLKSDNIRDNSSKYNSLYLKNLIRMN